MNLFILSQWTLACVIYQLLKRKPLFSYSLFFASMIFERERSMTGKNSYSLRSLEKKDLTIQGNIEK